MAIYGIYTGAEGRSHSVELALGNSAQALGGAAVANLGFHTMVPGAPGWSQEFHVSKGHGSIQIVLGGGLKIGVSGGETRSIHALPGDAVVFVDTHGDGHSAGDGGSPLSALNIRFNGDIDSLKAAFTGWPDDVVFTAP